MRERELERDAERRETLRERESWLHARLGLNNCHNDDMHLVKIKLFQSANLAK